MQQVIVMMPANIQEAKDLKEFVAMLKSEYGDSNAKLGERMGVSAATIQRIVAGDNVDNSTLDKIADYSGVNRAWLYELATGIQTRPRYSRTVSLIADFAEQLTTDQQEDLLVQVRALTENKKRRNPKSSVSSKVGE